MLSKYDEIRARRARGEAGFSLIELLVVVVIMGILIAIAIPVYLNYQNNAKKKSVEADVRNAVPSVEQCISDNGGTWTADTCGTLELVDFTASDGNTVTIDAGTEGGSYTITGTRTNNDPAYSVTYDSATGGSVSGTSAAPTT